MARYLVVIPTPAARAEIEGRIERGEVRPLDTALRFPPVYPGDLIPRTASGRAVLVIRGDRVEPDYYDAGSPEAAEGDAYVDGRFAHSGPPSPDQLVECECACGCEFLGRFDEVVWASRMLRCADCTKAGHAAELRLLGSAG
jgi:hypothetical protein